MARCSDLPPELIALIIDFHRGPNSCLRQYSLVCHAWLAPSQRRLFHTFKRFNLGRNLVPFRDFLLGAPHLGDYVRDFHAVGPFVFSTDEEEASPFAADATDRENVEKLFALLPNVTKIDARFCASSPFLFTNSLLRQCTRLRKFSVTSSLLVTDDVSPSIIFLSLRDTTVKRLVIDAFIPSPIDSPPNMDVKVCSVKRLTFSLTENFSVWCPYLRLMLPQWSELKIRCDERDIPRWTDELRANDLSHLRLLHMAVYIEPNFLASHFPHDDAHPLISLAPNLDHLLLITKVTGNIGDNQVIVSMVEWYLCTLTVLSRGKGSALKELSLTVMVLDDPTVAAAWAKIDNILSTNAFGRFRHLHFVDKTKNTIKAWSNPDAVAMLTQILPKLSRAGKLAV